MVFLLHSSRGRIKPVREGTLSEYKFRVVQLIIDSPDNVSTTLFVLRTDLGFLVHERAVVRVEGNPYTEEPREGEPCQVGDLSRAILRSVTGCLNILSNRFSALHGQAGLTHWSSELSASHIRQFAGSL